MCEGRIEYIVVGEEITYCVLCAVSEEVHYIFLILQPQFITPKLPSYHPYTNHYLQYHCYHHHHAAKAQRLQLSQVSPGRARLTHTRHTCLLPLIVDSSR